MHPMVTQAVVFVVVGVFFFIGIYCRNVLGHGPPLTRKEVLASFLAGFILFGFPLCGPVYYALLQTKSDLISVMPTLVPVFSAGFVSRFELQKLLTKGVTGPAQR